MVTAIKLSDSRRAGETRAANALDVLPARVSPTLQFCAFNLMAVKPMVGLVSFVGIKYALIAAVGAYPFQAFVELVAQGAVAKCGLVVRLRLDDIMKSHFLVGVELAAQQLTKMLKNLSVDNNQVGAIRPKHS